MRKSYLILAAAATILASCAESEKINNDLRNDKTIIGFSSYSEKATRGDATVAANLEFYHNTFVVYGSKKSTNDNEISEVFDGGATAVLTYVNGSTEPNDWTYSPYRYWDKQADYNFIAVAPNADLVKYDWNAKAANLVEVGTDANDFVSAADYTLVGQNLQKTATSAEITKGFKGGAGEDTDIMTSGLVSEAGASHNPDVNLVFKHILAKLNVTVAKAYILNDAEVYIKSLEITGLKDNGTYDESAYFAGKAAVAADPEHEIEAQDAIPATSGWTASASANAANYKLAYNYANDANKQDGQVGFQLADATSTTVTVPTYFVESLVMPQAVAAATSTLTIKYDIVTGTGANAHSEPFTRTLDMNQAFESYLDRHNYTLKITIEPDIITFDATSDAWENGGTTNKSIY
jgi:hypothetical protein